VASDDGVSSKTIKGRPGLLRALEDLSDAEADGLVVCKLDRLSRTTTDILGSVEQANRDGWQLHSIEERFDTTAQPGHERVPCSVGLGSTTCHNPMMARCFEWRSAGPVYCWRGIYYLTRERERAYSREAAMPPRINVHLRRAPGKESSSAFLGESEMLVRFAESVSSLFSDPREAWILVTEHEAENRIPDMILARLDKVALKRRLSGKWQTRPLARSEVRALRALRPDRPSCVGLVARRLGITDKHARKIVSELQRDGFARETDNGTFVRLSPIAPVANTMISFEFKRSDWPRALVQAQAHQTFATHVYVVFDSAFEKRFERGRELFKKAGVGLIALQAESEQAQVLIRPRRSKSFNVESVAVNAERILARILGTTSRPLPQARLPGARDESARREVPRLLGSLPRRLAHQLSAAVAAAAGHGD
jgi:hypothetical protein